MNLYQLFLLATTGNEVAGSTNLRYFLIAYIALWALIFGYLYYLHGRVKSLENDLNNQTFDPLSEGNKVTPSDSSTGDSEDPQSFSDS